MRAIASGVEPPAFEAGISSLELCDRCRACRLASASGVDGAFTGFSGRFGVSPEAALACIVCFCFTKLSFNSSTFSRFAGPPVRLNPALPRRMLSFRGSGIAILSVCALFSFPRAFLNSGSVLPLLSFWTWRDLRLALKSNLPAAAAGTGAGFCEVLKELIGENAGDDEVYLWSISGFSFSRTRGLTASGGGDFSLTKGGGDFGLMGGGDFAFRGGGDLALTGGGDFGLTRVGVGSALTSRDEIVLVSSGVSNCFVGEILRDRRFLFSSVIHDGCVDTGAVGVAGLSSDLVSADSSQLDLVGLHLLFGLDGDDGSAKPWLKTEGDATDFERLW